LRAVTRNTVVVAWWRGDGLKGALHGGVELDAGAALGIAPGDGARSGVRAQEPMGSIEEREAKLAHTLDWREEVQGSGRASSPLELQWRLLVNGAL